MIKSNSIFVVFEVFFLSIMAGISIAFGAMISLLIPNEYIAAAAFSIGIFLVIMFGFKLITGVVPLLNVSQGLLGNLVLLWVVLIGNWLGTIIIAEIARYSSIYIMIYGKAAALVASKVIPVKGLMLGIGCGLIIAFIVSNQNKVLKYLLIIPLIMLFILTKMEHCVANMFYMSLAVNYNWTYLLFVIFGNIIGGSIMLFYNTMMSNIKNKS